MELARSQLTVLLNALYDAGEETIPVSHPSEELGELLAIDLNEPDTSTVRISTGRVAYDEARSDIRNEYGSDVVDEIPKANSYRNALLAGRLLEPSNGDDIAAFLDRYGNPDLTAGHKPAVAGFDTNLLPWRIADVLELEPEQDGAVNGFALATGVRDELDWEHKHSETRQLEAAFGEAFGELWNQPAGARREGRLGENYYRLLRDHRYAEEVPTDRGDESIVEGYDTYQEESRKEVLLFSNDRDFVERARSHRVLAQRVEFPTELPREVETSWTAIQDTLYVLAVLFGVIELPKVTLFGVWKGKGGGAWQNEMLRVDSRSPNVRQLIERDVQILAARE